MKWKFLNTGHHSSAFNMEFDEALALQLNNESEISIFRLYAWTPSSISLGFHQAIEDFDLVAVAAAGFEIVRRPTGGKAILHAHELTYSVVTTIGDRTLRAIYEWINQGLLCGLHQLDIHAELSQNNSNFRLLHHDPASIPCFSSSAKSEIQFDGKKLIGSAQRRYGSVVLQHGSFLLGPQHRRIIEFLAPHVLDSRDIIEHHLTSHTTDAETILRRPISFEEAAVAIKTGFEKHCGAPFDDSPFDDSTFLHSHQLAAKL